MTPQRRLIFEILEKDQNHPTAEEIYQRVIQVMPDVSQATVYNTLNELMKLGELTEVSGLAEKSQRYETNHVAHHHLYCTSCHKIVDVEEELSGLQLPQDKTAGYMINASQVTFYGLCPDCQQN